jgi:two-component system, NarL family, nitrate/nitrite response regulator NarL
MTASARQSTHPMQWTGPMGTKVMIVEDHELLAQSLTVALAGEGMDVERVVASSPAEVLEGADRVRPAVVLLDLDLGATVGSSVPLIGPLRELGTLVVMLTGVTDRVQLAECVEAGAIGIVSKTESFTHLVESVKEAVALGSLLSHGQRDELLRELRRQRADQEQRLKAFERLTPRERDVLAALMDGRSAEAMAEGWVVSLATVRSQIRSVLMKLGVNSQLAAVALARRAGWPLRE